MYIRRPGRFGGAAGKTAVAFDDVVARKLGGYLFPRVVVALTVVAAGYLITAGALVPGAAFIGIGEDTGRIGVVIFLETSQPETR